MMCKAKVSVCSDIRTKHSTQSKRRVEFLNVKPWWYVKKQLGVKRLRQGPVFLITDCVNCSLLDTLLSAQPIPVTLSIYILFTSFS